MNFTIARHKRSLPGNKNTNGKKAHTFKVKLLYPCRWFIGEGLRKRSLESFITRLFIHLTDSFRSKLNLHMQILDASYADAGNKLRSFTLSVVFVIAFVVVVDLYVAFGVVTCVAVRSFFLVVDACGYLCHFIDEIFKYLVQYHSFSSILAENKEDVIRMRIANLSNQHLR
ncbi:Hypothetical predicted protein [Octopus vulgaris]|uniref:Uncharacterized protein n=1 Tax=Octopus vulgaris TaxID=6645 RepID=A0AA36B442_OCTVU|nr:Hypothetical predicted protein [Octopus vulgaris]